MVVSVHHPREIAGTHLESPVVNARWQSGEVRAFLSTIQTCEDVRVFVGGEQIEITLDEKWTVCLTKHVPTEMPAPRIVNKTT
jgi:hypothetical protein